MILLIITIVILSLIIFFLVFQYLKLKKELEELYDERSSWLSDKNKLSMIEMKVREYKEGKNIFTVMRDIYELISSDFIDVKFLTGKEDEDE